MAIAQYRSLYDQCHFDPGSTIAFPPGSVFGQDAIEIGNGTVIGQQVSLTAGMLPGQNLTCPRRAVRYSLTGSSWRPPIDWACDA